MDIALRRTAKSLAYRRECKGLQLSRLMAPTVRKLDKICEPNPRVDIEGLVHLLSKTVELSQETERPGLWTSSISQPRRAALCWRQKYGDERGRHQALEPVR
jgi:hypothetical protein